MARDDGGYADALVGLIEFALRVEGTVSTLAQLRHLIDQPEFGSQKAMVLAPVSRSA